MPLVLSIGFVWFVWRYQKQKNQHELDKRDRMLREQALLIEKQEAVEYERNRIATEMHDDLGSGLTTIKYLSEHAMKSTFDEKETSKIKRIADHANTLVSNMSEIIWAMNSRHDTASDLSGYIRHYASGYLEEHGKTLSFSSKGIPQDLELSGEKRRNLFLVTKEILHNFIKHGNSPKLELTISMTDNKLLISFLEIGNKGFNLEEASGRGNGLFNMQNRMKHIGGTIQQEQTEKGFRTIIKYSLN